LNNSQLGGDIDKYAASNAGLISKFSVSIPSSGIQSLRLKVSGKNSASSGHLSQTSAIIISPQV
jgi:hypothetical protein